MTLTAVQPCESCGAVPDPTTGKVRHVATTPIPDDDTLEAWVFDVSLPEATDGCTVDPDGKCEHGHTSWLRRLGLI